MQHALSGYRILREPYYQCVADEVTLFEAAYALRMPMILKGPTGCGKTRFIEYMAWRLRRPLITLACNEDTSATDLVGRYLLDGEGTTWHDGPLTMAARHGAICYLDEVVEARQDAMVVLHPLTDSRRVLPLDKCAEVVHAHPDFQLVVSYNPGYQSGAKDLKTSTRQRFGALAFAYPAPETEAAIVARESGVDGAVAAALVTIAHQSRALQGRGLEEGLSPRMLIQAGRLIAGGVAPAAACRVALSAPLSDQADVMVALDGFIAAQFHA